MKNQLRALKRSKATGLNNLPPSLLKDISAIIAKPLCYIINLSLRTSTVLVIWKQACIVPIHKSGPTSTPENYRPISILPALSEILEKAIHRQLLSYLESNCLLSNKQFGFRVRRSTDMAVILVSDMIRQVAGKGKLVGAVFLDLSRAFDTINHGNLLTKLATYGIRGDELEWFTSYLFQRTQVVDIGNTLSQEKPLFSGVPQGSILGPLFQRC